MNGCIFIAPEQDVSKACRSEKQSTFLDLRRPYSSNHVAVTRASGSWEPTAIGTARVMAARPELTIAGAFRLDGDAGRDLWLVRRGGDARRGADRDRSLQGVGYPHLCADLPAQPDGQSGRQGSGQGSQNSRRANQAHGWGLGRRLIASAWSGKLNSKAVREADGQRPALCKELFAKSIMQRVSPAAGSAIEAARITSGPVAQRLELAAHNRLVPGSSPGGPTNKFNRFQMLAGHQRRHGERVPPAAETFCATLARVAERLIMQPVTLSDLTRDGKLLWAWCASCGRERDIDPASVPLPGDYAVPEVGARMRCTACGGRKVRTAPELYPGGIVVHRDRWRSPFES